MRFYLIFITALLGLALGSFCNAWAWRIVHGESIARGRSHCPDCSHILGVGDLVPLFSWLFLKGRCRYCGAPISKRYPLTEGLLALYFVSVLLRFGLTADALRLALLGCLLLTASLVDYDTMELPDALLIAAAALALLRLFEAGAWKSVLIGAFAVSVPLLLIVLLMDKIMKRETMGGGDIKLMAVLGMHFGAMQALLLLVASCFIGIFLAFATKKGRGKAFPFGPVLSLGAWFTALFGWRIIAWYISLF